MSSGEGDSFRQPRVRPVSFPVRNPLNRRHFLENVNVANRGKRGITWVGVVLTRWKSLVRIQCRPGRRVVNEADPRRVVRFSTTLAMIHSTRSRRQARAMKGLGAAKLVISFGPQTADGFWMTLEPDPGRSE